MAEKSGRKPRKPRKRGPSVKSVARKATQQSNIEGRARRDLRSKMVSLESRMTVLERLLETLNTPARQQIMDDIRTLIDGEEE